jgi:Ca2+-binding RTX toxin-like protein
MTKIIGTTDINTGIRVPLAANEGLFVAPGITVGSTDNTAINGPGGGHVIDIAGAVSGALVAIRLGTDPTADSGNRLFVAESGHLAGFQYGVYIDSRGSSVENAGTIWSAGTALQMSGNALNGQSELDNSGLIDGNATAIRHDGSEALIVINSGTIKSLSGAYLASGSGIDGITNTGHMVGNIQLGGGNDWYSGQDGRLAGGAVNGQAGDDFIVGGVDDDNFSGGADNDLLRGNGGSDTLDGDTGIDRMFGGVGDDYYYVDNVADIVDETGGNGVDRVYSYINFSLSNAGTAIGTIENLFLTSLAANGTGNALANTIYGNTIANILDGAAGNDVLNGQGGVDTLIGGAGNDVLDGGTEADHMLGGIGNDVYRVDNAGDIVNELGGNGIDTVLSSVNFNLADAVHAKGLVERLTLTGTAANGLGNALANVLVGNGVGNILAGRAGNDVLSGGGGNDRLFGGLGNDSLTGGANSDIFVFDTPLNAATNRDTIADFNHVDDTIQLENAIFAKLSVAGALNPGFFFAGAAAHDANDYIVYNQSTGALIYDVNANAAGGASQFATIADHAALAADDFVVI